MRAVISIHDPRVLKVSAADLIDDRFVRTFDENGELGALYAAYAQPSHSWRICGPSERNPQCPSLARPEGLSMARQPVR
jgi:hypothetical protein